MLQIWTPHSAPTGQQCPLGHHSTRLNAMFKHIAVGFSVGVWVLSAFAQPGMGSRDAERDRATVSMQPADADAQIRRAALRQALQAQRDGFTPAPAPAPSKVVRQLNPQERAELREQLRQQRRDSPG